MPQKTADRALDFFSISVTKKEQRLRSKFPLEIMYVTMKSPRLDIARVVVIERVSNVFVSLT